MRKIAINIVILIMVAAAGFTVSASSFSSMTLEEISALLTNASAAKALSAMDNARRTTVGPDSAAAVNVNAHDLITKLYGVVETPGTSNECLQAIDRRLNMQPREDAGVYWLDSADGYALSYYGMSPEVTAMARFNDKDSVAEYCYFFIFPYEAGNKENTNGRQADFSYSLLQEMKDMGMPLGANGITDDLFEVTGDYRGNFVDVRLLDDPKTRNVNADTPAGTYEPSAGRFIPMFIVEPDAFTPADSMAAL